MEKRKKKMKKKKIRIFDAVGELMIQWLNNYTRYGVYKTLSL